MKKRIRPSRILYRRRCLIRFSNNEVALFYQLQELPMWYPLKNLKSNCAYVDFKSSGCKYEFSCKENVLCSLIERFELGNNEHCFKKAHVEFIAMENEKTTLTMCMYPNEDVKWNITCDFSNPDQARQFHKLITKDRLSELVNAYSPMRNIPP